MSEVDASSILLIDRSSPESKFATTLPVVQDALQNIGSIHNIHLARLWSSRKLLYVEGKDVKYLKILQNKLYPDSDSPLDAIPNTDIGGWSGWQDVVRSRPLLRNALGQDIRAYCILDSDYHTEEEISERKEEAANSGICLYIWKKKEIENYILNPEVIKRCISMGCQEGVSLPSSLDILNVMISLAEDMKDEVFDALSNEYLVRDRSRGVTLANTKARRRLNETWKTDEGRLSIVPGKKMLSNISAWAQDRYGVSLSFLSLLRETERNEIHYEIVKVLRSIERRSKFR